jgi:RNA polymerase primary sigma factor
MERILLQVEANGHKPPENFSNGDGENGVDLVRIHLDEISATEVSKEANRFCAAKILKGQFALLRLSRMTEELSLSGEQNNKINALLENPKLKLIYKGFWKRIGSNQANIVNSGSRESFIEHAAYESACIEKDMDGIKKTKNGSRAGKIDSAICKNSDLCIGAEEAFDEIVTRNLRLGFSVAKKYQSSGVPILDLCQTAYEGIMIAATSYDGEAGYQFSTYASWMARQKIKTSLNNTTDVVRVPTNLKTRYFKLRSAVDEKIQEMGRGLTTLEKKELLGESYAAFERVSALRSMSSLEQDVSQKGDGLELGDLIISDDNTEEQVFEGILHKDLYNAMEVLDEREREIIELSYGINCDREYYLHQIGLKYGFTTEWIRQLRLRALSKLYDAMTQEFTLD